MLKHIQTAVALSSLLDASYPLPTAIQQQRMLHRLTAQSGWTRKLDSYDPNDDYDVFLSPDGALSAWYAWHEERLQLVQLVLEDHEFHTMSCVLIGGSGLPIGEPRPSAAEESTAAAAAATAIVAEASKLDKNGDAVHIDPPSFFLRRSPKWYLCIFQGLFDPATLSRDDVSLLFDKYHYPGCSLDTFMEFYDAVQAM